MVFPNLEAALPVNEYENYLKLERDLHEPTRTSFLHFLDINALLKKENAEKEALVFGGYAVLSHLESNYGALFIESWRGSEDIDMLGSDRVHNLFRQNYLISDDRMVGNLPGKRTIRLNAPNEPTCRIDYCIDNRNGIYEAEEHEVLGIPVQVASPRSLIRAKLPATLSNVSAKYEDHKMDILFMLKVLENRGVTPKSLGLYYTPTEADKLEPIVEAYSSDRNSRLVLGPSPEYVRELRSILRIFTGKN